MTYLMINVCEFLSDCLKKGICCGYSFELHLQVDAIQMSTHNICLYKKVDKKYTGCNLKTTELGVCAVIRSNTVFRISACMDYSTFIGKEEFFCLFV